MNILITSVMGHIGYALALKVSEKKYKVFGVYNKTIKKRELLILKNRKINLIKKNFESIYDIKKIINDNSINCCIHTAAVSHEIYAKKDPYKTLNINSIFVLNFLEILKKNKKIKFINISTGSVFQDIKNSNKIYQNTVPTPKSIYSGTKRMGEIFLSSYKNRYNLNCCTLRISWVYGPPISGKNLLIQRGPIPNILYKIIKKKYKTFNLKSGKDFKASFTYIDDVTNNILKLIRLKKIKHCTYHLGTGKNNTLIDIFKHMREIYKDIKFKIGKGSMPWSNDSVMRGPIINKKNKFLNCKYDLKTGLYKYSKWMIKNA